MIIFAKLLLAHLIGDFLLQPVAWIKKRESHKLKSWALYLHVFIHGALVFILIQNWKLSLAVTAVHLLIEVGKLFRLKPSNKHQLFLLGQLFHVISLVVLYYIFCDNELFTFDWLHSEYIIFHATAVYFLTQPMSMMMYHVLRPWSDEISEEEESSLAKAGRFIGTLERLFVYAFIVSGRWEAVGFLLAAKSVFRFGDLRESKERKLTEYILIGTLLSFGLAILVGVIVQELLK